ncbi:hypothetical protein GCM10010232_44150 [Streptomyces amakusaensis]
MPPGIRTRVPPCGAVSAVFVVSAGAAGTAGPRSGRDGPEAATVCGLHMENLPFRRLPGTDVRLRKNVLERDDLDKPGDPPSMTPYEEQP